MASSPAKASPGSRARSSMRAHPSLVVSLWDVADVPTSGFVPAFYRAWLRGTDKAGALDSAQLALIREL